ncbi:hypothetical protein IQ13_0974 [Lacibacter cauensis]|uniref:DUF3575 domain-containing protein n=1 Tax=Lacibacter cauensis TaxID=510947 RepID=A0A562SWY4_9BACT|nr:hypothetical protein IQ13_0974 [Lacibacter cauensis]
MYKIVISRMLYLIVFFFCGGSTQSQNRLSKNEIGLNFFRNPSIGLEYRYRAFSVHSGIYVTNFERNRTWRFFKSGLTFWFLPVGNSVHPSSFYVQLNFLRGLNLDYKNRHAFSSDIGYRLMLLKGLQARLGITGIIAKNKPVKINPTPSINYSFFF